MLEWSAAAAAAAFVVLTAAVIVALRSVLMRIDRFERSIRTLEAESAALMREMRELTAEASETVQKAGKQLERTDRLFRAVEQLGDSLQQTVGAVGRVTAVIDRTATAHVERAFTENRERIGEVLEWAEIGWAAWQWWRSKRDSAVSHRQPDEMRD